MTKGEIRKARKQARNDETSVEFENGRPVMVRPRTESQERKHESNMNKWARKFAEWD